MELMKDALRKRLAQKYLGNQAIGVLTLKVVQDFFDNKKLEWYVKFTTLFIISQDSQLKIEIFRKKKEILDLINKSLEKYGYIVKIRNIFVKVIGGKEENMIVNFSRK